MIRFCGNDPSIVIGFLQVPASGILQGSVDVRGVFGSNSVSAKGKSEGEVDCFLRRHM